MVNSGRTDDFIIGQRQFSRIEYKRALILNFRWSRMVIRNDYKARGIYMPNRMPSFSPHRLWRGI